MQQRPNFLQTSLQLAPTVTVTIAINIVVFLVWQFARDSQDLAQFMFGNLLPSRRGDSGMLSRWR